jgi:pSer/pThr/pTyr-binding forkhead associated (FHA) protein
MRDADVRLSGSYVGRQHGGIDWNEETGQHSLFYHGSFNGVLLNGREIERLKAIPLVDGDVIKIGGTVLVYQGQVHANT